MKFFTVKYFIVQIGFLLLSWFAMTTVNLLSELGLIENPIYGVFIMSLVFGLYGLFLAYVFMLDMSDKVQNDLYYWVMISILFFFVGVFMPLIWIMFISVFMVPFKVWAVVFASGGLLIIFTLMPTVMKHLLSEKPPEPKPEKLGEIIELPNK